MGRIVLLGPQRFQPMVRDVLRDLDVRGPIAVVTAGWQERESEDRDLREHLGCEVVDLLLYHRTEDLRLRDREFADALRQRQERLHELQDLYRLRLDHALAAARTLMARAGSGRLVADARSAAIRAVRTLDRQHLRRIRALHDEFEGRWKPAERAAVARHREQIRRAIEGCAGLAIAGGHVAVLLNRLRLMDLAPFIGSRPLIAWSAGAMALSPRVVLFHDSPPQGAGNAEVFDAGLGLAPDVVALPHAQRRLRLDDPVRVSLLARRFSPAMCAVLESESRMDWDGGRWTAAPGTRALGRGGRVRKIA